MRIAFVLACVVLGVASGCDEQSGILFRIQDSESQPPPDDMDRLQFFAAYVDGAGMTQDIRVPLKVATVSGRDLATNPYDLLVTEDDHEGPRRQVSVAVVGYRGDTAVAFGIVAVYNYFQAYQHRLGIGSNSWEDHIQRQVSLWNEFNTNAVYPLTPQGVTDRVRLDKVTIVPDCSLPLNGGLPTSNPDNSDRTIDLQWGSDVTVLNGTYYSNHTSLDRGNPFYLEPALIHELGHARYLIDYYAMDLHINSSVQQVQILENGSPVAGTALMPYLAWDSVLHYNINGGIMGGPYGWVWSPHEAKALELIAGRRASQGNMNAAGNVGVYLKDLPLQNHL